MPNIEIEKTEHAIPGTYLPKPYKMTIKVPLHNYMVSKRVINPPYIKLSKDELQGIFYFIAKELDYDIESINYSEQLRRELNKTTQQLIDKIQEMYNLKDG